jgi:restriction endonuclease
MAMSLYRIPITGWRKCVHEAAAFETKGEYAAAILIEDSTSVVWWFRNDPPRIRIPTPIGHFEPDFVFLTNRNRQERYGILEIKGDIYWDGEESEARIKAKATLEWIKTINATSPMICWEFAVVLDQDAIEATSFEGMLAQPLLKSW